MLSSPRLSVDLASIAASGATSVAPSSSGVGNATLASAAAPIDAPSTRSDTPVIESFVAPHDATLPPSSRSFLQPRIRFRSSESGVRAPAAILPPVLSAIDHVGIAVEDLDASVALYRDTLGISVVHRETVTEQGVEAALLDVGDSHLELLAPLGPDTAVGRFLARRGPGIHHVAYRVASIDETLNALATSGVRLIDERPRSGIRGSRVAFVHPSSTDGVLTEIVEPAH